MQTPQQPGESEYSRVRECLYRSNSSGIFYALIKRGGKQIRRSLKTRNLQFALRKLTELRGRVSGLRTNREQAFQTFRQVADTWLKSWSGHLKPASALRREVAIKSLLKQFAEMPVRNITRATCESWAEKRSHEVAASTFNQERDTLALILEYARREGLILDNPAEVVTRRRQPKAAILIPSREQFEQLVDVLQTYNSRTELAPNFIQLLAYSGMRKAEASSFRWEDIDFEAGTFTVTGGEVGTKNHEARVVPLFPVLRGFLERLREEHPERAHGPVVPVLSVKKALASSCAVLARLRGGYWSRGCSKFTHHSFRHYFVSNAIEKGVDFKTIAAWIGHKDGGVLVARTYGHMRDTHSVEMANRIVS